MACPQLGVILAYWKQTGVSSPKNPIALAVGVSNPEMTIMLSIITSSVAYFLFFKSVLLNVYSHFTVLLISL